MKTNLELVEYCRAQLGRPYWYGTFGQMASESLYKNRKKVYPKYYTATDFAKQYGRKVHDCVGLIKGFFWTHGADSTEYTYQGNGMPDVSADGLFKSCTRKGNDMKTMPRVPGIAVFMKGHVGIFVGGCDVIEARGHAYGVVTTKLCARPWTGWAYLDQLEYIE